MAFSSKELVDACVYENDIFYADDGTSYVAFKNAQNEIIATKFSSCFKKLWSTKVGVINGQIAERTGKGDGPYNFVKVIAAVEGGCYVVAQDQVYQPDYAYNDLTSRITIHCLNDKGELKWSKVSQLKHPIQEWNAITMNLLSDGRVILGYKLRVNIKNNDRDLKIITGFIGLDSVGVFTHKAYTYHDSIVTARSTGEFSFLEDVKNNNIYVFDYLIHSVKDTSLYRYTLDYNKFSLKAGFAVTNKFEAQITGSFTSNGKDGNCRLLLKPLFTINPWFGFLTFTPEMDSISILKYDLDQKVFNIGGQFVSNGKNSFGVIYNSEKEPFYYHVDEKSRLVKAFEANYASYPKFSVNRNNRLLLSDDFRYVSDLNCLNNLKITYFDTSFATNNCAKTLDISLGFPVKERFKTLGNSIELLNTFGFTLKDTLFESDEYSLEAQISCSNNTGLAYANLGNDTVVCDTFVLSASIFKFPKAKYYWNTGDTSFAIRVDSSGKYDLRVTNGGCTSYDSINIIFDDDLELSIDYDSVLCINDSLPLFLNKVYPYNLVYTFPNNIKVNSKNGDTIYIKEPGNYRVKSANTSGCKLDRQFNVYSTLVSAFAGRDSIFCKGSTISLNGAGNGSPKWEPSNLLMNPDSFNPTWTNVLDTFFILNVADESGCTASDTVYFMTFSKPTAFLQNDTIEYCVGEPTELKFGVTNGKPPYQLDWKNGDENQSGDFKIKAWIAEGEDNFKIKVTDSCKNEVWFYRNFLKRETGLEELLILPNDSVKTGSEIIIKSSTGNELTFKSKNGEKEVSREFKFSNKDNGMYSLQIGTLDSVCKSDTVINLWFYQVNWYLPNAFTPSDNNLINDEWTAYCANCKFKTISIFNKGGQMVFKTESGKAWDGTFKNEKVPSGTYYFITKAVDFDGSEYTLSGNILLLE